MTFPRVLAFALLLAAFAASSASADVRVLARDEALDRARVLSSRHEPAKAGERVLAARKAPFRFNLVGLHWRGSGDVSFRTGSGTGAWSAWRAARPEAEDGPDAGGAEAAGGDGWNIGNPYWTDDAERIQYRLSGNVTSVRAHFVSSPLRSSDAQSPSGVPATSSTQPLVASRPGIISRSQWGANESIVRRPPRYADRLAFAVVHHTAGAQPSSRAESAAIVRGIQAYHVLSNGWDDIGYNFLVDRFGQVFEGKGGGIAQNVIGAHAKGFNTGSVGVSLIGTYGTTRMSTSARAALVSLLAWRLDVAHVYPLGRVSWISGGSPRFAEGTRVTLNAIGGHRDTGLTTCPGSAVYSELATSAGR